MHTKERRRWAAAVVCGVVVVATPAFAHGDSATREENVPLVTEQKAWGVAGDRAAKVRTIRFLMSDRMRFAPDRITVQEGETIRFVVKNNGKLMHEFVIGTREALDEHASLMKRFPQMEHDEPYMAHVQPGRTGEIVWKFNRAGEFDFACLIAGHYDAGMVGRITVVARIEPAPNRNQ